RRAEREARERASAPGREHDDVRPRQLAALDLLAELEHRIDVAEHGHRARCARQDQIGFFKRAIGSETPYRGTEVSAASHQPPPPPTPPPPPARQMGPPGCRIPPPVNQPPRRPRGARAPPRAPPAHPPAPPRPPPP